jgi:catechol 2,3-dioxygenase-like lactoylglutathione lyase family enzyme
MTATTGVKYNVGGVLLDRPFKITRLGHFGYNATRTADCMRFYTDLLGFRISDQRPGQVGGFLRYGSDHHALVVGERAAAEERARNSNQAHHFRAENDINQITWQVQSLREVTEATAYFRSLEMDIRNEGRAGGPGSNFHLYVYDPDEQVTELYYGIEQIGWDGHSKPPEMRHGMLEASSDPHLSEYDEVQADLAQGIDIRAGYRHVDGLPAVYDVDGILLPRPFKVTRLGPVSLFVDDVAESEAFYREVMGFEVTETVEWQGATCSFLRCNNEHHSLALYPKAWREVLGMKADSSSMSLGLQLANYQQLRDAVDFLRAEGVRVVTDLVPPKLYPGIDYAAYAFDPDGHAFQLYYYMEQVGWDGRSRPTEARRPVAAGVWPETLEPLADTYRGEPFMGPWG